LIFFRDFVGEGCVLFAGIATFFLRVKPETHNNFTWKTKANGYREITGNSDPKMFIGKIQIKIFGRCCFQKLQQLLFRIRFYYFHSFFEDPDISRLQLSIEG
jgi:hypothetical protein